MLLALAPPGQQTEITGDTISPRHAVTTRGGQLLTKLYNEKEMQDAVKAVAEKQVQQETCGALGNTKGARRFETFIERICELSLRLRDPPAQRACPAVCTAGARLFAKSPHDLPDFRHWETGFGHRAQRHRPPGAGRPGRAAPSYNRNLWNAQPLRNGYVTAAPPSGSWNLEPQISARGTGTPRNRATGAEASRPFAPCRAKRHFPNQTLRHPRRLNSDSVQGESRWRRRPVVLPPYATKATGARLRGDGAFSLDPAGDPLPAGEPSRSIAPRSAADPPADVPLLG